MLLTLETLWAMVFENKTKKNSKGINDRSPSGILMHFSGGSFVRMCVRVINMFARHTHLVLISKENTLGSRIPTVVKPYFRQDTIDIGQKNGVEIFQLKHN